MFAMIFNNSLVYDVCKLGILKRTTPCLFLFSMSSSSEHMPVHMCTHACVCECVTLAMWQDMFDGGQKKRLVW